MIYDSRVFLSAHLRLGSEAGTGAMSTMADSIAMYAQCEGRRRPADWDPTQLTLRTGRPMSPCKVSIKMISVDPS